MNPDHTLIDMDDEQLRAEWYAAIEESIAVAVHTDRLSRIEREVNRRSREFDEPHMGDWL